MNKLLAKRLFPMMAFSDRPSAVQSSVWATLRPELLAAIHRAHDQDMLNPEVKATSQRAHQRAIGLILRTQENFSYGSVPYIVVPGDGGIIVEWAVNDNFVSLNIDSHNRELDVVYSRQNGIEVCEDFTYEKLDELLIALFSGEEIATANSLVADTRPQAGTSFVWSDTTGSGTSAYAG